MAQPTPAHRRLGQWMMIVAWLLVLGLLTYLFQQSLNHQENPNRHLQSQVTEQGVRQVVLQANRDGHYLAPGFINGQAVKFVIDTGATDVHIPAGLAEQLHLTPGHPQRAITANGIITVYSTTAQQVSLGGIVFHNIEASLNPHMPGEMILLGMSFLKHLQLIQNNNQLLIRQIPPGSTGGDFPLSSEKSPSVF